MDVVVEVDALEPVVRAVEFPQIGQVRDVERSKLIATAVERRDAVAQLQLAELVVAAAERCQVMVLADVQRAEIAVVADERIDVEVLDTVQVADTRRDVEGPVDGRHSVVSPSIFQRQGAVGVHVAGLQQVALELGVGDEELGIFVDYEGQFLHACLRAVGDVYNQFHNLRLLDGARYGDDSC